MWFCGTEADFLGVPRAFRGIRLAPLGLALAIDSLRLPGDLYACPADRRIVVTAGVKSLLSPCSDGAGMRKERPDPSARRPQRPPDPSAASAVPAP